MSTKGTIKRIVSETAFGFAHPPGGLHEPLLDNADESETMARDSPCPGPIGVFQFR